MKTDLKSLAACQLYLRGVIILAYNHYLTSLGHHRFTTNKLNYGPQDTLCINNSKTYRICYLHIQYNVYMKDYLKMD
jgi:hypothetical protein